MLIDHANPQRPRGLPAVEGGGASPQLFTPTLHLMGGAENEARGQFDLAAYWRTLSKRRWTVIATVALALTIGVVVTLMMRPMYTATSTLQIDREAARVLDTGDDVTPSDRLVAGEEFFQTQYGLLRSQSLAIRVAEVLGLARNDDFVRQMGADPSGQPGSRQRRDQVVGLLRSNLTITPVRGSRLVNVSYSSPNGPLSARISNAFAENFIRSNLDRRFEASSYAREFLERRLAQTRARLEQSERDVVGYAQQQRIIQLADRGAGPNPAPERSLAAASLEALNDSLASARAQRIAAEQRWRQAQSSRGLGLPEMLSNPTIQQLTQTRARLQAEYQQKSNLYMPDYPEMVQLRAQIQEIDRQLGAEASNVRNSIRSQYASAAANEAALAGQVRGLEGNVLDLRNRSIQYNILQREVDTNRALYDGLLQRYKEVGVAGGIQTNNISVVDRADPPGGPSSPRPLMNLGLAGASGLLLGIVLAFGLEALDQALRVPADVENKLRLPVLGSVPVLAKGVSPHEALRDTRSALSESYHSLRSALQFSTEDGFPRSLLVTSTRPGEGKSTTAFAVAQNIARLGFRTLLIDADLRNPSLHKSLGLDNKHGLSNVLTGSATLEQVVQTANMPNLFIMPCGPLPPNPAELLASKRLKAITQDAMSHFDVVVFDGPPVMGLADAPMIGSVVVGALLVIEAGKTSRTQAQAALRRLEIGNTHMLGATLTKFDARSASYGYGYAYEYEYDYGKAGKTKQVSALKTLRDKARDLINVR